MTASYRCDLGDGQQIVIENQGTQTVVAQMSAGAGQQQSQRSSFTTGSWQMPPTLFRTTTGVILRVEAADGQFFMGLHGQYVGLLQTPPLLAGAEVLPVRQVAAAHGSVVATPLETMQPMQPLKPLEPMRMQMGTMQMQMHMGTAESTQEDQRFCGQCGHAAAVADRFCTRCGHRLT